MRPKTHSGFSEREKREKKDQRQAMFAFRVFLNLLGVTLVLMAVSMVSGLEVEEGERDLIGLGEGTESSPSPLLNPTLTLTHFANEFICPPLSANSRREEKEEENYREEKEGKKE